MELIKCGQPWFEMQIEYHGGVGCCCYFKYKRELWDFDTPFDVDKYWNGKFIQNIREIIASNNPKGTGCEGCQYIKYGSAQNFMELPSGLNKTQQDNWRGSIENYNRKSIVVDSYPVKYYMNFSLMCNLKCIMCCQENERKKDTRQLPVEQLLNLKEYFIRANELAIIGGEPFLIPNARKFISGIINDPDYADVKLSIFTNGTLLHNFIENLQAIRRINICISLDSIGGAYEYIRQGAVWQQTEKNIIAFKEVGAKNNLEWAVNIAGIIMKSSIPRLVEFVDWCIENDTPVHFVPLNPQGFTDSEDVMKYPGLLDDVPDWEDIFDTAIAKLTKRGWISGAATPLTLIKNEIKARIITKRGEDLFVNGDIHGALEHFIEANAMDPSYINVYNNTGVAYWETGEIKNALQNFVRALQIDPNNRDTILNCGKVLVGLGRLEDARKLYAAYLLNNPNDDAVNQIYSEIGDFKNSADRFIRHPLQYERNS